MDTKYTTDECLQEYYKSLEKQLKEKDAMIDWLAERIEGFCSHIACYMYIYEDDRYDECPVNKIGWRKAAQEAVKKNEKTNN